MKKSKKALLWTIVPVLGVSSGVAGAVAGVTNQKTSVDTNNVATPGSATTMATKSSRSTSNLKIVTQSTDVSSFSEGQNTIFVSVSGASSSKVKYEWFVNRGKEGKDWQKYISGQGVPSAMVKSPKTSEVIDWTFKCKITDLVTGETITSEDIKFTTLPINGRYIRVTQQPEPKVSVGGGQEVTLTTNAETTGLHKGKKVGYQWFEYDSSSNKFTEIKDANKSSYTFTTASSVTASTTKKYVCKYYIDGVESNKYLNESNQSIVTISKDAKEKIEITSLSATPESIKVGESTTLSVIATSTKTANLKYQWFKSYDLGKEYEPISDVSDSPKHVYTATKDDEGKDLLFSVLVSGTVQDGKLNHLQSKNVKVTVGSSGETSGITTNEAFTNNLSVETSVTTNQASVKESTFILLPRIKAPEYTVNVEGGSGLSYKWYYVSGNKKQLISDADKNVLKTNRSLYEAVYRANDKHRVGIMCEIYQGNKLVKVVDEKTNSRFYMTVITRR